MKELTLEEIKEIELRNLCEFDAICKAHNFRYSLAGGTMLGAIRHKGFIPWDDDIDLMMPRPDYEKFIEYCKHNNTPFSMLCAETNNEYKYLFAKLCDRNTVLVEDATGTECGIYIDIFPIDGLGNTYEEAKCQLNQTRFKRELLVAANWKNFFRSKTRAWYIEPIRFAFFVLSRFCKPHRLINDIQKSLRKVDFEDCKYVGAVMGAYREREIQKASIWNELWDTEFENIKFSGVKDYDSYLSTLYGDYMKLPPKEKQVTHHSFKAYLKKFDGE